VAEFRKNSGIQVSFDNPEPVEVSSVETSTEITQLLKEALNNVQKHSRATRVAVTLKAAPNAVELCVEDNGTGFPFAGSFDLEELERLRIGPASIRRRLKALNGGMILDSRPHLGARLRMRIPV
jgi:signal transduction histidine kinase